MYKSYRAYTGTLTQNKVTEGVDTILAGINEREEDIVSVTAVGLDNIYVVIITKDSDGKV